MAHHSGRITRESVPDTAAEPGALPHAARHTHRSRGGRGSQRSGPAVSEMLDELLGRVGWAVWSGGAAATDPGGLRWGWWPICRARMLDDRRARRRRQPGGHTVPARSCGVWDTDGVGDDRSAWVVDQLSDPAAVQMADETGDVEKGTATVGTQRVLRAGQMVWAQDHSSLGEGIDDHDP